jgi:hypothetical protein
MYSRKLVQDEKYSSEKNPYRITEYTGVKETKIMLDLRFCRDLNSDP